jgi:DNA modification methylase
LGAGTTGVAAVETGRAFWGCEIDAERFALAKKRIEAVAAQANLLDVAAEEAGIQEKRRAKKANKFW